MTTIEDTIQSYHNAALEAKAPQLQYVKSALIKEKSLNDIEPRNCMHLKLSGNEHLTVDQKLTDSDIDVLCKILKGNTYITSLDLRYNKITDAGAKTLAKAIEETTALLHINLCGNDITEEGAIAIAKALQENETVREIRMRCNKIGNAGGMAFAQMLQVNTSLQKLDLADTNQKTESIIALATVLKNNSTLQFLNVSRPLLFTHQEEPTVHFAKILKGNRNLKGISMRKFDMRDFGVMRLSESLFDNMALTHLDLSCNRITRDGIEHLAKVLKNNTAITHLDLSNNRLECPGAELLGQALGNFNTNLISVSVRYNNIKGKGLCKLADAMKYNTTVNCLYVWGNVLEESAAIAFSQLLEAGRFQKDNIDVTPYVVDDVTILGEMNNEPHRFEYWKPVYGDDVPDQLV